MMKKRSVVISLLAVVGLLLLAIMSVRVGADGSEALGPPSITIAQGSGIVMAGTGMVSQPGTINIIVPSGATVKQVLLYWEGLDDTLDAIDQDDETIRIKKSSSATTTEVTGTKIGSTVCCTAPGIAEAEIAYRKDITSLNLVSPGSNTLEVSGMSFKENNGAGIVVIFEEGSNVSDIQIRDGADFAFAPPPQPNPDFPPPLDTTTKQAFNFIATDFDRMANLALFVASISGAHSGEQLRPNVIEVTVSNGSSSILTKFVNELDGKDGAEWDTFRASIPIPAGYNKLEVQVLSRNDTPHLTGNHPASLTWVTAAFSLQTPPGALGCRVTGGGTDSFGLWNGTFAKGQSKLSNGTDYYQFGGQAGASTGSPPQPKGEWTHHQQSGPDGSFVFHAGTSSAPPGTKIDRIICSDPGYCIQARPAPAKQIDFEGIGTFKSIKNPSTSLKGVKVGTTYHWFEVHIEDLGEPGKGGKVSPPASTCPATGASGSTASCGCPDFYRIKIFKEYNPQTQSPNKTTVIYQVYGYINGGNLQIHPPL